MKGIIDRFVGDYAVVEFAGRRMVDIHKRDLPANSSPIKETVAQPQY